MRRNLQRVLSILLTATALSVTPPPPVAAAAPDLISPEDGTIIGATPVFEWRVVRGATQYFLQLSTDATFSNAGLVYQVETASHFGTPTKWLPDRPASTPYYWRVGARQGTGSYEYGATWSFAIDRSMAASPTLYVPADQAEIVVPRQALLLSWSPVEGADAYKIEVSDIATFTAPKTYTTKNTALIIPSSDLAEQTLYYWRVAGTRKSSLGASWQGAWSTIRSFRKRWPSLPQPLSPGNGFTPTLQDPFFAWTSVMGAQDYQIQISPNGDWTNNVVLGGTETDPVWVRNPGVGPLLALEDNQYYWRVRARDAGSIAGQWTAYGRDDAQKMQKAWLDAPSLTSPANDTTVSSPVLRWDPVPGASAYRVQISTDPSFGTGSSYFYETDTEQAEFAFQIYPAAEPPPRNTWLYWRVRPLDNRTGFGSQLLGPWSNGATGWRFIFGIDTPVKLTSINGERVSTPHLSWTDVGGAATYLVTLWNDRGSQVGRWETANTDFTPSINITTGSRTSFSWTVYAKDAAGTPGAAAPNASFSLIAPAEDSSLALLTPADGARSVLVPNFSWTPFNGAAKYAVFYRKLGETVWTWMVDDTDKTTPYTSFTPRSVLSSDTYEWFVEAQNSAGVTLASSPTRRFVIDDLVTPTFVLPATGAVMPATPAMTWSAIRYASFYRVVDAKDSLFNAVYHDGRQQTRFPEYRALAPAFVPRDSYPDTTAGQGYFWWVIPCKGPVATGTCRAFTAADYPLAPNYSKHSAAVTLSEPPSGTVMSTTPTLAWQKTRGARYYRVQVATDPNFATTYQIDNTLTDATTYVPQTKNYPDGVLYWRVNGIDASGNELTASEVRRFTKISPPAVLATPSDGAVWSGTPYFTWTPVTDAVKYDLQVSAQSSFGATLDTATIVGGTGYIPATKVYAPATYYWRVRGRDASDDPMTWSAAGRFAVTLDVPSPIAPLGLIDPGGVVFRWTPVARATSYRLEVSTGSGAAFESAVVENPFWAPSMIYPDGDYSFKVSARDAAGNEGPSSDSVRFSVGSGIRVNLTNRIWLPVALNSSGG